MLWVLTFFAIAVAGVVMVVCYSVWLAHKASDVLAEISVLGERGADLAELVASVSMPATAVGGPQPTDLRTDGRNAPRAPFRSARGDVG